MPRRLLASPMAPIRSRMSRWQLEDLAGQRALALPDGEPFPLVDERLDADFFDPPRQVSIRLRALQSFVLVLNPGVALSRINAETRSG